mgnify:CR=1 FL=1|tara:strand:- start:939 stop:1223 length:285 start_codon:yes stop_codon:yes gene_type:complete
MSKIIKFHHHKSVKLHHDEIDKKYHEHMNFVERQLRENTEETIKILRRIKYWEMHAEVNIEKIPYLKLPKKIQLHIDELLSIHSYASLLYEECL